jgi:gluconolactonase
MLQPNDLALSTLRDTLIYLSGQDFAASTGDLWTCDGGLAIQFPPSILLAAGIGRTNGIETSPCGSYLYVSSAVNAADGTVLQNKIFKFALNPDTGAIIEQAPELFFDFAVDGTQATDVDGMRTDVDGNLFVTRNGKGQVVELSPEGKEVRVIVFPGLGVGAGPANLEFGGDEGKTLTVIGKCLVDATKGCAATFESDVVGKAFARLQKGDGSAAY